MIKGALEMLCKISCKGEVTRCPGRGFRCSATCSIYSRREKSLAIGAAETSMLFWKYPAIYKCRSVNDALCAC